MLEGLLWILLGLIVLAVVALSVPVDVTARFDFGVRTRGKLRIGWLFGLVRLDREIGARKPTVKELPKEREKKRGTRRPSIAVIRRGFGLLGDLLHRVRIRRVELDLAVGTEDPASTGELVGFAAPVVAIANAHPRTHISVRPDFAGSRLDGVGVGEISIVPIGLIPPVFAFALSPEVRAWFFAQR